MRYLSLCSGIEAATQAWHPLGWRPVAFSEIDPFPCAVLAHHYPQVPNWGDMTRFQEWPDADVDVLVGGTPCQSFSVAGLRKGLADPRGNLMLTYLAIADRYRPRWIVWENVPGVLSSGGGRDFGAFLGGLGQIGYGFAWRVLDAQYVRTCGKPFAVPQRRRRVFVVGYLGDWRRAAAVLVDREGLRGDSPPRRKAGQTVAPTISARPTGGGGLGTDFDCDGGLIPYGPDVSPALKARDAKGPSSDGDGDGAPLLALAIQERAVSENPDAGPDGVGVRQDGAAYTIGARQVPQAVAFDLNQITSKTNRSQPDPAVHHTLPASTLAPHLAQPVAFDCKGTEVQVSVDGSHPTLRSMGHNLSHQNAGGHAAVAFAENSRGEIRLQGGDGQVAPQLTTGGGKPGQGQSVIAQPWAVRRLTPVECERLQGFPDGYTDVPYRRRNWAPDGPRYKALGNSMAVNCMEWIGERIAEVEAI